MKKVIAFCILLAVSVPAFAQFGGYNGRERDTLDTVLERGNTTDKGIITTDDLTVGGDAAVTGDVSGATGTFSGAVTAGSMSLSDASTSFTFDDIGVSLTDDGSDTAGILKFSSYGNVNNGYMILDLESTSGRYTLSQCNSSTAAIYVNSSGYVGIGTAPETSVYSFKAKGCTYTYDTGTVWHQVTSGSNDASIRVLKNSTSKFAGILLSRSDTVVWNTFMPDADNIGDGDDYAISTSATSADFIIDDDTKHVGIGLGTAMPACRLEVAGAIKSAYTTVTTTGPTDNLDVSGVNTVEIDTSSNNVTIGGFTGGIRGQKVSIVVTNATNNAIVEHAEGTGNQDIYLSSGADETITASYGGWELYFDGAKWCDINK